MRLFITMLAALTSAALQAQDITVTGKVYDAGNGEPVPYASVHLEGTMTGVSTDEYGFYSIKVPHDGTLVYSSIGYTSMQIAIDGRTELDVALEPDAEFIDETIVIAYGTASRSSFTPEMLIPSFCAC